jgi:transposase
MVSDANFKALQNPLQIDDPSESPENAFGFLLGMTRRRNPEAEQLIDQIDESAWIECPVGITAQEKQEVPRTRVQEVTCDRPGVRVFVVDSEDRRNYEQRQREKSMARVRESLDKVRTRIQKGRLKKPEKIGAAAERALKKSHGHRYYAWELKDGELCIVEHPVNLPREKKYEGKYLIQTDQQDITPLKAVEHYKELSDVESGFRCLKDPLSMRPIFHRAPHRVQAHIFVAALAFLIDRMLGRRLKTAGSGLSTKDAWNALQTIRHITFKVNGQERAGVTPGSNRAREVLNALGLSDVRPPVPSTGPLTIM